MSLQPYHQYYGQVRYLLLLGVITLKTSRSHSTYSQSIRNYMQRNKKSILYCRMVKELYPVSDKLETSIFLQKF